MTKNKSWKHYVSFKIYFLLHINSMQFWGQHCSFWRNKMKYFQLAAALERASHVCSGRREQGETRGCAVGCICNHTTTKPTEAMWCVILGYINKIWLHWTWQVTLNPTHWTFKYMNSKSFFTVCAFVRLYVSAFPWKTRGKVNTLTSSFVPWVLTGNNALERML